MSSGHNGVLVMSFTKTEYNFYDNNNIEYNFGSCNVILGIYFLYNEKGFPLFIN